VVVFLVREGCCQILRISARVNPIARTSVIIFNKNGEFFALLVLGYGLRVNLALFKKPRAKFLGFVIEASARNQ